MEKVSWLFLTLVSCSLDYDHPCEDINNSYMIQFYKVRNIDYKEENLIILDKWIKEVRNNKCSPDTYYKYYKKVNDSK